MRSRLPIVTELALRKILSEYPINKDLIDDALEEAIDPGCRKVIREDIALGRGYASSPIGNLMCEMSYKREKFRAKLSLARRFGLEIKGD